jgi:hypothetical protein
MDLRASGPCPSAQPRGKARWAVAVALTAALPGAAFAGPSDTAPDPAFAFGADLFADFSAGQDEVALHIGDHGELVSQGWTAAVELGWQATADTTISIVAGTALTGRDVVLDRGSISPDARVRRGFIELRARQVFAADAFRLIPSSTLQFATETSDPGADSASVGFTEEALSYGRLSGEIEAAYALHRGNTAVDIYANIGGEWDFLRTDRLSVSRDELTGGLAVDGRAAAGVTFRSDSGLVTNFELSNSLVGPDRLGDTALVGSIAIRF